MRNQGQGPIGDGELGARESRSRDEEKDGLPLRRLSLPSGPHKPSVPLLLHQVIDDAPEEMQVHRFHDVVVGPFVNCGVGGL